MKKLLSFIGLAALLIVPLKVNAAAEYSHKQTCDANGVCTVSVYVNLGEGETYPGFEGQLAAENAFIIDIIDADEFVNDTTYTKKDETNKSAVVKTVYKNADPLSGQGYVGTGKKVEVLRYSYKHDSSAPADAECSVSYIPNGADPQKVTPTKNPPTGSMLPYVGIVAGIALIATAYVISKKSTKLYRM